MPTLSYRRLYFLESGSMISYIADSIFFCSCHGCIKDSSYFQNLPSLFSPFLTSFGRVMELLPDLSGQGFLDGSLRFRRKTHGLSSGKILLVSLCLVYMFPPNCWKAVVSTFCLYCVFPRLARWADIRLPVVNQKVFVTGVLQGISASGWHGSKCPCLLIVEFSSLSAQSFPRLVHCTPSTIPETSSCLQQFRHSFESPATPSKAPPSLDLGLDF